MSTMKKKKLLKNRFVGLAMLIGVGSAGAMDLLQAFEAARKQDPSLLASRATAEAGRERLPQARAQMLPNLSASLSQNNNQLTSITPDFLGREQTTNRDYRSSNQTVQLRQPLFRPFLTSQYRQTEAQVLDAEATLAQEEQNLAVRVSGAYFDAVLSRDQLALVLAQRNTLTAQLEGTRKMFAAGSGTRTDVDEAQARLDMVVAQEIEARQNVAFTLRQLQILVNEPIKQLASLNVAKLKLEGPKPADLDDWTLRAEQNSPQLASLKAQLEAARQEVKKAQSGHLPTLDAIAQLTSSESENVISVSSRYNNNSIGLQLNIPIFSGGGVNASVRQALANVDRAEQALEAGRRDLGVKVHKHFRGITENIPKVAALEQALRSAEQLIVSNKKSFQAGSRTIIDILNAEQQHMVVSRDLA
jgi:outer membrane protein/protease secretion system outer membrane protein